MAVDLDVAYVAHLARLKLTDEETRLFQEQLAHVLAYVARLHEVDVTGVEEAAHASPIFDVLRDDAARAWFTPEEALQNAPQQSNDLFIVPKVVE